MPVTAKLSRQFYERLGDDIADELVNWFNMVDETYRTQLRELNELNFGRFDAKLEERFAKSDAKLEERLARMEQRLAKADAKIEEEHDAKWDARFAEFSSTISVRLSSMETTLRRDSVTQMRWVIGVLLAQAGVIITAFITMLRQP